MDNYININHKEKNQKIYRIVSIPRLLEMFDLKVNTLVKPQLWDDPFENFICASTFRNKSGNTFKFPLRNRAYGQCWTLKSESDAMWRIYAPNKDGVKIKTTIRTLYVSLKHASQNNYPNISCFIGKVDYCELDKLEKFVKDTKKIQELMKGDGRPSKGQARTLLLKLIAFEHEEEVRLLYLDPHNKGNTDLYQYPCDPFKLIKSIIFDPRMDSRLFKICKTHLENLGYQGKIDQSKLYNFPQLTIAYEG